MSNTIELGVTGRKAWSIDEFCVIHGFSRAAFYRLRNQGLAPKLFYVGTRPFISEESATAWRAERTEAA